MTDLQIKALKQDALTNLQNGTITKIQYANRIKSIDKIRRIENK